MFPSSSRFPSSLSFPFFFRAGRSILVKKKKKEIPRFYPPRLSTRAAAYFLFDNDGQ